MDCGGPDAGGLDALAPNSEDPDMSLVNGGGWIAAGLAA